MAKPRNISIIEILEQLDPDVPMTPRMLIEAVRKATASEKRLTPEPGYLPDYPRKQEPKP